MYNLAGEIKSGNYAYVYLFIIYTTHILTMYNLAKVKFLLLRHLKDAKCIFKNLY